MRKILGFAVLAVIGWIVLKIVFKLLGFAIGLAFMVLAAAAIGFVFYMILRLFAPGLANKVKGAIDGKPSYSDSDRVAM